MANWPWLRPSPVASRKFPTPRSWAAKTLGPRPSSPTAKFIAEALKVSSAWTSKDINNPETNMKNIVAALNLAVLALALSASNPLHAADKGFVPLFPEDGVPKGWSVRNWDDVG